MKARWEHPAAIPGHIPYYYLLLLLPLLRGVRYVRLPNGFPRWLRGTWFDEAVIASLLVLSAVAWSKRTYDVNEHRLRLCRGIFWQRTTRIPLRWVTTLTVERPLWLRLLRAARVSADTDGGNHRLADVRLTVWRRQAALFLPDSERGVYLRAKTWRMVLLSLLSSDSFGGVLLLTAAVRQSSVLLGESIRNTVMDNLEAAADAMAAIPRTAALLILVLAVGWLTGTVRHLLRHLPFALCRREDTLTVYMGTITKRIHCCAVGAVNYIDIRQTLAAHILRLYTVYINCTGYGKDKNTLAVVIPPCRRFREEWQLLFPHLRPCTVTLRPAKRAWLRYLRLPLLLLLLLPIAGQAAGWAFPVWRELAVYLSILAVLPCLWLGAVRMVAYHVTGVGYQEGQYSLCYAHRLTLHRVTVPAEKVAAVHIRRSLWQRRRGVCDLWVYSHHEFRRPHKVRHLKYDEVKQLLKEV
ncbi:MAG: PH domain-containing protein [Clostridia bacterium]|nr:PH domain-containing protein [Clostridia bacterium]